MRSEEEERRRRRRRRKTKNQDNIVTIWLLHQRQAMK
jgi:urease accessory protein UreE